MKLPWRWMFAAAWAGFAAYCVSGFPPCVDLPAHGAQLQTLVELLKGDPLVAQYYRVTFPLGYGIDYWLFLPLAWLTNGAFAVRAALFVTLLLYPLSALALLRAFKRPDWLALLSLPLAFNVSYWYGLLPGLFAQPLVFFCIAVYARAVEDPRKRWVLLLNLFAGLAMLAHLLAFAVGAAALFAWAVNDQRRAKMLRTLAVGLALPSLLALPKVYAMAFRAVTPGDWPATEYAFASHFNWFFRNYRPEGWLAAAAPLAVCAALFVLWLRRRREESSGPAILFFALVAIYLAMPKTLSGIFLVSVRLPVLAGMLALPLVGNVPRWLKASLLSLVALSLVETAAFHRRFARAIDGLAEMIDTPPPERHGYVSLVGRNILGSRHVYLDHLGQWWTARWGKVGHNFFADAEHHPVKFKEGVRLPGDLLTMAPGQLAFFDELLVFGDAPLPAALASWQQVERAGQWRRLRRPAANSQ